MRHSVCVAVLAAGALLVGGCGSAVQDKTTTSSTASGGPAGFTDRDDCGVTTSYPQPPQRAVALTSNATETMLALGLEGRMVGTAYMRGRPIAPAYADAYKKVKVLSSEQPTLEQLMAANPDFVYSGYPDGFSPKSGHTRDQLQKAGIKTRLNPEGCAKGPVSVDDIYAEVTTVGEIFGVSDRAKSVVNELKARVDAVQTKVKGTKPVRVFLYASGTDKAATTGGNSMATAMIKAAGGENVFADVPQRWMSVSWEQVAARRPDVILVREEGTTPQYQSPSVAKKIEALKAVPVIADTPAIKNQAFPTITLSQLQPGPYSVEGIEHLARQFHPDKVK